MDGLAWSNFHDVEQDSNEQYVQKQFVSSLVNQGSQDTEHVKDVSFATGVAFRPFGGAKDNWVAYVGAHVDPTGTVDIVLWVQNAVDKTVSQLFSLGKANWLKDGGSGIAQYKFRNFFQITAGDYDGDGKDSIVVYAPCDPDATLDKNYDGNHIFEYEYVNGTFSLKNNIYDEHLTWRSDKNSTEAGEHLACSLATGDFDGDGIEEFAVSAYSNALLNSKIAGLGFDKTEDVVLRESSALVSIWKNGEKKDQFNLNTKLDDKVNEKNAYSSLTTASIAAGDIDNDGLDEIVAAGYVGNIAYGVYEWTPGWCFFEDADDYGYAVIQKAGNNYSTSAVTTVEKNAFVAESLSGSDDNRAYPPLAVACFAMNGAAEAEHVFISGDVFNFSEPSTDGKPYYTYTPFKEGQTVGSGGAYVETAVTGDFTEINQGREQVLFTIVQKDKSNTYTYSLGVVGGSLYNDDIKNGKLTSASKIAGNQLATEYYNFTNYKDDNLKYILKSENDDIRQQAPGLNCVLVSLDCDDDGLTARYNKSGYSYTDPQVETVLQAAPYFDDLGGYDNFNNNLTTYSVSTSYETSHTSTDSVSFGAGFAGETEVSLGGAGKVALELGYTMDWQKSFTDSIEYSYETSWTAADQDLVVIKRTPVINYFYDIYNAKTKAWEENAYRISVPKKPMYYLLTVDEYNRFVDLYNTKLDTLLTSIDHGNVKAIKQENVIKLLKIDDKSNTLPIGNEGNPNAYYSSLLDAGQGAAFFGDENAPANPLGHGGGSTAVSMTETQSTSSDVSISHGFSFSLTVMAGVGAFGTNTLAGGYTNLDYSHGTGYSKTVAKSNGASGTVANIPDSMEGISKGVLSMYGFNWQFGKWTRSLTTDQVSIPVFGYFVNNVSSPNGRIKNLNAVLDEQSGNGATLTWSVPESTDKIVGYQVYRTDDINGTVPLTTEIITNLTYSDSGLLPGKLYTYNVTTLYEREGTTYESTYSNPSCIVTGLTTVTSSLDMRVNEGTLQWRADGNEDWTDLLNLSDVTGTNGADGREIVLEVVDGYLQWHYAEDSNYHHLLAVSDLIGANGNDGSDGVGIASIEKTATEGLTDTYTITYTDGTTTTFSVTNGEKGADGSDGTDGVDGTNGANGLNGTDGTNGLNGTDGKAGANGQNGTDGTKGENGLNGNNSTVGVSLVNASINDDGYLILTMNDGSSLNAGLVRLDDRTTTPETIDSEQGSVSTRTIAIGGLAVSSASLLRNIVMLIVTLLRKRTIGI